MRRLLLLLLPFGWLATAAAEPALDAKKMLGQYDFWVNRDFAWYEKNIPLFDCPDAEISKTYYYRWELVTRHLVYGNPNTGYVFTEFADRPFWSGAYGTISCSAGHQIYETRWLRDPRYVRDYVRFWMRDPGAEPRNYSFWAADAAWAAHEVYPNKAFITDLLPDLIQNYRGWEKGHWVEDAGLFWQTGHDDGMEFDINARQTKDILRGGQSLRPSFNAYLWADATAISRIAKLQGDSAAAEIYATKAAGIKTQLQKRLWDPLRAFFFPMSNQAHEKGGFTVKERTLTYQSGQYAGSLNGRELHGYVPWEFNLPDPGYENAWTFLMDEEFFKAPFGPTTVERHDPQFLVNESCCWWSGQSWPFATAQTLKAMANLLQRYKQEHVKREDYTALLHTFAATHRKDGKPYIAEGANPFTGSWAGYDAPNHSEHYFHSSFNDLVITGLAGLEPSETDTLVVDPLAPAIWDYFALERVNYHGHELSIRWDRTGEHYKVGQGLQVLVDGKKLAGSPQLARLSVTLPSNAEVPLEENPKMNYAVNNDGDYYPRYAASYVARGSALSKLGDGQHVYDARSSNRWTTAGSPHPQDSVEVDFGAERPIDTVKLCVLDDGPDGGTGIGAPSQIQLDYWNGAEWRPVPDTRASADHPLGNCPHTLEFAELKTSRLRATFTHAEGRRSGLTEFEAWGSGVKPYASAPLPAGNLAYNRTGQGYPKASASHSDVYGGVPPRAIDGKIVFEASPSNRWTSYGSPDRKDWLQVDFGKKTKVGRAVLYIYDDRGGVQAPVDYTVEGLTESGWKEMSDQTKSPRKPVGNTANVVTFAAAEVEKVRVVFTHDKQARSGVTELELWEN